MKKFLAIAFFLLSAFLLSAGEKVLFTASGGAVKTLDPIYAEDLSSRDLCAAIYDTLVEYDYTARPYRLIPGMLTKIPEPEENFTRYRFELREDLFFIPDPVFQRKTRRVTSHDVLYSVLRLADARNHSPLYWLFRGKIRGLDAFRKATLSAPHGDESMYRLPEGFSIQDDRHFTIFLTKPDPRFLYMFAMPNAGIVPHEAVRHYGERFARHPVGSGPFRLEKWIDDCRIELVRSSGFRRSFFTEAQNAADRLRPLPLLDRIVILPVKQQMTSWLLFLQGNLDLSAMSKENLDLVQGGAQLPPALEKRGVKLLRVPQFEITYVGFNFSDPKLGRNRKLRQAISLAYNVSRRVEYFNGQLLPGEGPIPPGVAGYDEKFRNPYAHYDLERAKKLLAEAGYPNGIDPETQENLILNFDQSGDSATHRQLGELAVSDLGMLGLRIRPVLNYKPRFYDKLRQGRLQLFRLSWVGDYPDAENFLQLFYSGNCGGCNRTGYSNAEFDRKFERARALPDSPERTRLYRELAASLAEDCVWIYEGFPVTYQLTHAWLENYLPHDFGFIRWKYLSVDPREREMRKKSFRPLSFQELSGR